MSLKVLLADDSMTAQNMGRKILSESGYDVTTVSNGAAAVKKIAEVKPDVVILDIYMPGYTGLEVCERVRANFDTANMPVLLTVGKMEPYRAEDGAKVRADGVIVKPFEATDLLAIVKKLSEKISAAPQRHVVEEPEQEETTFQQFSQPEHAMPSHVDVPSEIAVAPAMAMEEFNTGQAAAAAAFAAPVMDWSAPVELAVEHAPAPEASSQFAEVPWSFDQPAEVVAVEESAPTLEIGPSPDLEFTSAPQVGAIEAQQVAELEPTIPEAPVEIESVTDPTLASAQEVTEFVTSFGTATVTEDETVQHPEVTAAEPEARNWDGWAHAEPEVKEETKPVSVIDDFEAKVAAAMSGFGTEPVEPAQETTHSESAAQPVDDFEARVAAAMSGFATEPMPATETSASVPEPEVALESHQDPTPVVESADDFEARVAAAMSGFSGVQPETQEAFVPPQEAVPETLHHTPEAPSSDDFDSRIAEAMAGFDHAPEAVPAESTTAPAEETQEFEVPALSKQAISLNETMVLPQEAVLSLEEEMKRAAAQHAPASVDEAFDLSAAAPVPESIQSQTPEVEHIAETEHFNLSESLGEFDPMHAAPQLDTESHSEASPVDGVETAASSVLHSALSSIGGEKLTDAVHRAIDRLKPQLIAEIMKELKGE